jgi:hypothetical protein
MNLSNMKDNNFLWLLNWFQGLCNGDWEHGFGIRISALDNPGWSISINLEDTELENEYFQEIKVDHTENKWLICFIKSKKFEGRCGPVNLPEVLNIFREWAENCQNKLE